MHKLKEGIIRKPGYSLCKNHTRKFLPQVKAISTIAYMTNNNCPNEKIRKDQNASASNLKHSGQPSIIACIIVSRSSKEISSRTTPSNNKSTL